jgi:hypothetical protein
VGGTYGGGVLVLSEPQPNVVADRNKVLGKIEQTNEKKTVKVDEKADWGLSMTGPVSNSEMQGILDAIRDLKPPRKISFHMTCKEKMMRKEHGLKPVPCTKSLTIKFTLLCRLFLLKMSLLELW